MANKKLNLGFDLSDTSPSKDPSIKARWDKLDGTRKSILERARQCSALTIPSLLPPEGSNETTILPTPYQGLGARGVNNLASKLLLALLPPNAPFFRLAIDDLSIQKYLEDPKLKTELDKALGKIEMAIMMETEAEAIRVPAFEALKHLIVTGNTLIYLPDEGGMKIYRMDQYTVKRDPMGNVLEIITKEKIHPIILPESVRKLIAKDTESDLDETVDIYTRIVRGDKKWEVSQEVEGYKISESAGTYKIDDCPWLPLRWTSIAGEDWGRGLVEEYLGDLISLEGLTKAIVEGAAIAAKVVFMVNPNSTTRPQKVAKANSGDIIEGNREDVGVLQAEKFYDFQIPFETIKKIEQRLSYAFLLMTSIQRDAERVTAEEIRQMAKELEDSLGGVYSVLSQEMQLPIVHIIMVRMTKTKKLPELPKTVKPVIVTGLEALGRGNDLNKLTVFVQTITGLGPEVTAYLNVRDVMVRIATALGITDDGMVRSEEEVAQIRQQAQMSAMAQSAAPGMLQEVVKGAMNAPQQAQGGNSGS